MSEVDLQDVKTHRAAWLKAMTEMQAQAEFTRRDETDDASYWQHEIDVFGRTFDALEELIDGLDYEGRPQWAHKIVQCLQQGPQPSDVLKHEGSDGWQLAAAILSADGRFVSFFFKRPVNP